MKLIVLTGPTACGKTRLAAALAHHLGTTVLSADSRQVYRGLDIGTGKDLDEFRRYTPPVPVRLVDLADPADIYSLHRYKHDLHQVLLEESRDPAVARGAKPLVLCGGSGLYLEAILKDYTIADVPEDPGLRARLMARPLHELLRELAASDPALHARTDHSSQKRVVRALEVAIAARERPVAHSPPLPRPLDYVAFVIRTDRAVLRARIDARLRARLAAGLIEEVEQLVKFGITRERLDMLGMEYREVAAFLRGEIAREAMETKLATAIHQLAKRQETYFRGMPRRGIPLIPIAADDLDTLVRIIEDPGNFRPIADPEDPAG